MKIEQEKLLGAVLLGIALLPLATACFAAGSPARQTAGTPARRPLDTTNSGFHSLDLWTAAVLAGDRAALKHFYSTSAEAYAQTPQGKTQDAANEESAFWCALPSHGLSGFTPKILEEITPRRDIIQLVLRVEMTLQSGQQAKRAVVVVRQTWVRKDSDWQILETRRSDPGQMEAISLPQPKVPNMHLYADPNEARLELVAATSAAKADRKRVLVVFGANWCYDCHVLDATLHSKEVAPLVVANYHVVHINIGDGDSNADLADRFQVPLKKGIPSLAVLDDKGQLITSQKQGEFESAAKIGMSDVLGFLNRWKPPAETSPRSTSR